ncbi:MAG: HEPN domain-containing protein [Halanaerobiales bacterium]
MSDRVVKEYLNKSKKKIEAAQILYNNKFYNDCISRCYYSMFWAAKALLLTKGLNVKTHKGLITKFGLDFVKKGYVERIYGKALRIAKENRETADYEIDIEYTKDDARESIKKAKEFHEKIITVINDLL